MTAIISTALCSAILYMLIKKYSPEYSVITETASVVILLLLIYPNICDVIDFFTSAGLDRDYTSLLLKITGIAVLTQFAADVCSDAGETALASKVEFAGKSLILSISLPMVKALLEFAIGLINEK